MEQSIALLDTKIQGVNNTLDEVLEQESEQRASINELKERFRKVKRAINENKASFFPVIRTYGNRGRFS